MKKLILCTILLTAHMQYADDLIITRAKKSDSDSISFLCQEAYTPAQLKARLSWLLRSGWQVGKMYAGAQLIKYRSCNSGALFSQRRGAVQRPRSSSSSSSSSSTASSFHSDSSYLDGRYDDDDDDYEEVQSPINRSKRSVFINHAITKVPGFILFAHGLRGLLRECGFTIREFFSYLEGTSTN